MKKIFSLLTPLAIVACTSTTEIEPVEPTLNDHYVFENVRVLPMTGGKSIDNARVVVRDDRIVVVEGMSDGTRPVGATVIDGTGKTLTPGLADMHVHYWPETGPMYIANSITTVRNLWGNLDSEAWDVSAKTGAIVAPHHYFSGPLMDGPEPIWGEGSVRIASVDQVVGAIEAQRSAGFKAVKLYEGLTPDIYRAAVAAAQERDMQVWTHTPGGLTYEDVIALGVDSIEHLNNVQDLVVPDGFEVIPGNAGYLTAWSVAVPDKMTELAQKTSEAGVWNAPTYTVTMPQTEYEANADAFFARPEMAYLGPGLVGWWRGTVDPDAADNIEIARTAAQNYRMMIKALYDAGAPLLIGTDSPNPFTIPALAIHDELQAFVDAGIPVEEVLRIATSEAARFFGEEGQWGVIAPDARADLVLLDTDPLTDLSTFKRPLGVMMNGHWYDRAAIDAGLETVLAEVAREKAEAEKAQEEE